MLTRRLNHNTILLSRFQENCEVIRNLTFTLLQTTSRLTEELAEARHRADLYAQEAASQRQQTEELHRQCSEFEAAVVCIQYIFLGVF